MWRRGAVSVWPRTAAAGSAAAVLIAMPAVTGIGLAASAPSALGWAEAAQASRPSAAGATAGARTPVAAMARRRKHAESTRRSLQVNDHAKLALRKAFGSVLIEEGAATGTLPGHTWVRLTVGSNVHAAFTIHAAGGSISGTGVAALKSSGRFTSFGGSLTVVRGTGAYAHAHGKGKLYGVIDRRKHDALTVTTKGTLFY